MGMRGSPFVCTLCGGERDQGRLGALIHATQRRIHLPYDANTLCNMMLLLFVASAAAAQQLGFSYQSPPNTQYQPGRRLASTVNFHATLHAQVAFHHRQACRRQVHNILTKAFQVPAQAAPIVARKDRRPVLVTITTRHLAMVFCRRLRRSNSTTMDFPQAKRTTRVAAISRRLAHRIQARASRRLAHCTQAQASRRLAHCTQAQASRRLAHCTQAQAFRRLAAVAITGAFLAQLLVAAVAATAAFLVQRSVVNTHSRALQDSMEANRAATVAKVKVSLFFFISVLSPMFVSTAEKVYLKVQYVRGGRVARGHPLV